MWWIIGGIILLLLMNTGSKQAPSRKPTKTRKASPEDLWIMTPQDAQKAVNESRVVWIKYKDAKGQLSEREVDIYAFDDFDFQVFDHKREQIREFLFERVIDFKITDQTFTKNLGIASGVNKRNNRKNLWIGEVGEHNTCRCPNCGTMISLGKNSL